MSAADIPFTFLVFDGLVFGDLMVVMTAVVLRQSGYNPENGQGRDDCDCNAQVRVSSC